MFNATEAEERAYLEHVKSKLKTALEHMHARVRQYAQQIKENKAYIWENKAGMDHVEKIGVRQAVDQTVLTAEAVVQRQKRVRRLLQNPYFGRFDFSIKDQDHIHPIYIGIHAFYDEDNDTSLVYDWRAPIATLFYDYEVGEAQYIAPEGKTEGFIHLKRQYRIRESQMEYMLETQINVHDEVLQKELSASSDDKMKNIVATIQRDQNAIIRNEDSEVLIIQGVAGSGKTSIALHRIAFLLYRFKDTIQSKDILIISPNKVFADYISNVLPELGEEEIPEKGIEELARECLGPEVRFQTFFEQVARLLDKTDEPYQKRILYKASQDFLNKLDEYIKHAHLHYFEAEDIHVHGYLVPAWFMQEKFQSYESMPIQRRLIKIAKDVESNIGIYYHYDITAKERAEIKSRIQKMFKFSTLKSFYKNFYDWLGKPQMCKMIKNAVYEYSDVFPLIYLKMAWEGLDHDKDIKHLLVDEMQDYTPVQYTVLARLFPCKKTILGDAHQSVNPFSSSRAEDIQSLFENSDCVKLNKSYRSTLQITRFAKRVSPNNAHIAIERHGEEPQTILCQDSKEELKIIIKIIEKFKDSDYQSMGIITRTQAQAQGLYEKLQAAKLRTHVLNEKSTVFRQGVLICSAHMAKGLEFDAVHVPGVNASEYAREVDRSMLYVALTRGMHQLSLSAAPDWSPLLKLDHRGQ